MHDNSKFLFLAFMLCCAARTAGWRSLVYNLKERDDINSQLAATDKYYCIEVKKGWPPASATSYLQPKLRILGTYSDKIAKKNKCSERRNNHIDGRDCKISYEFKTTGDNVNVYQCAGFEYNLLG